jgi:hypothetical protein
VSQVPVVRLEQGGTAFELSLGSSNVEILEGVVLGSVLAASRPTVELDDARLPVSWHQEAKLAVWSTDLTNQVGFHRLSVQVAGAAYAYDFQTRTAKATWDEVRSMAEVCASSYLGYRRQFTYMAASGATRKVRLPQIHYAWLRDRLPQIERLVRSIDARPATRIVRMSEVSLRSKGLSVAQTSRLLRERRHLLERADSGPVQIGGENYWPSRVVVNSKARQSELAEHAQMAAFLHMLRNQCQDLATVVAPPVRDEVFSFSDLTNELLNLSLFRNISIQRRAMPTSVLPTEIQRTDRRYGHMRDLQAEYGADIADSMDYARSIRANVREVWDVYQTFVAHVVGNALGLEYFADDKDLRKRAPQGWSMKSEEWILYFDTKLPKGVLGSWRDATSRPANERPDVVLLNSTTRRALLLDAKFKLDHAGNRATQADLFEMQGYLNSYGTNSGGIIFPGSSPTTNVIASGGNTLLEMPIRASHFQESDGMEAVHRYVRDVLNPGCGSVA